MFLLGTDIFCLVPTIGLISFYLRVMASLEEERLSLSLRLWAVPHLTPALSHKWTNIFCSQQWISPTLMRQQSLQLQELFLSDWVRVPLTFSHFTETVLKRPSQSPVFMAQPSQGPTDLMDITRINQTLMPTRSSSAGDEAWLCTEGWHDSQPVSLLHWGPLACPGAEAVFVPVLSLWGCHSNPSEGKWAG